MKNKKTSKKLKYFLDHPQIKRAKSPGNTDAPKQGRGIGSQTPEVKDFARRMGMTHKPLPKVTPKPKKGATLEKAIRLGKPY